MQLPLCGDEAAIIVVRGQKGNTGQQETTRGDSRHAAGVCLWFQFSRQRRSTAQRRDTNREVAFKTVPRASFDTAHHPDHHRPDAVNARTIPTQNTGLEQTLSTTRKLVHRSKVANPANVMHRTKKHHRDSSWLDLGPFHQESAYEAVCLTLLHAITRRVGLAIGSPDALVRRPHRVLVRASERTRLLELVWMPPPTPPERCRWRDCRICLLWCRQAIGENHRDPLQTSVGHFRCLFVCLIGQVFEPQFHNLTNQTPGSNHTTTSTSTAPHPNDR